MPAPSDLVHETTTGTGTGNLDLSNVNGKRSFNTAFGNGAPTNVFDYFISHRTAAEWERGTGHMSDSDTLVRDTVIASSNSNNAVNFSAGTKDVTNDIPASRQVEGPGSSTDLNVALWNSTTGRILKQAGTAAERKTARESLGVVDDGWIEAGETWTYASASTFTISGDLTGKYQVGDKIKLTQTSAKYFYLIAISHAAGTTTVTITGGSDYTLANAAITSPYYSRSPSPFAFPAWFNHTPVYTGFSVDPSGVVSRFRLSGTECHWVHREATDGTSNATTLTISLPIAARTLTNAAWFTPATVRDNSATPNSYGFVRILTADTTASVFRLPDGSAFTASGGKRAAGFTVIYEIAS